MYILEIPHDSLFPKGAGMNFSIQLNFLQQLLSNLRISSCVFSHADRYIPSSVDLGLRKELFHVEDYVAFLANSVTQAESKTIYRFFDEYDCHYIFVQLSEEDQSFFFIGPYLLEIPSNEKIQRRGKVAAFRPEQIFFLEQYYQQLPLVEDENLLLTMMTTLMSELWGNDREYSLEYVNYAIPDLHKPVPSTALYHPQSEAILDLTLLEQTYANEKTLMDAVSKGHLHLITPVAASVLNNGAEQRLPDSLRDRKNYMIILKTLLRKSAEYGGVHPLHIHHLSSHFAKKIENIRTIKESLHLQEDMIRSFCVLVKNHSLSQYSYFVGQAITLVQFDLTADLSLKAIAGKLNVNASYLSALFHKEYGCTLTDFVNQERIQHGIQLLNTSQKTVQDIAADCGFSDTAYFIRLFKKQTGFTPNQYRENFRA